MRRILGKILCPTCVPQGNLDQFLELVFEGLELLGRDVLEGEVTVGILLHPLREEPEVIIVVGARVVDGELLFLRQVHIELHVVRGSVAGHEPAHNGLEDRLEGHHIMREDRLIGGGVAKMFVLRQDVMKEGGAAAPMPQDKDGVMLEWLLGELLLIATFLDGNTDAKEAADGLCEAKFSAFLWCDVLPVSDSLEGVPVGSYECIDWQFAKFNKSHV